MSLIKEHMKIDLTAVLHAEIELLRNDPLANKDKMDPFTFDPTSRNCFMGQLFGSNPERHRDRVGRIALDSDRGLHSTYGGVTPLEVWSCEEWKNGNRSSVMAVFYYIKGPTPPNLGIINWDPAIKIM